MSQSQVYVREASTRMQSWELQLLEGILNISNYKYPSCSLFLKRHSSYKLLCLAVSFALSNLLLGLVFQFSCCCLKLSTSQPLPGPLSSSGLSLLPWKQGYTYQLCFYNCVPLTCEELEPIVFWVWSSPTQWHNFLVLEIILRTLGYWQKHCIRNQCLLLIAAHWSSLF